MEPPAPPIPEVPPAPAAPPVPRSPPTPPAPLSPPAPPPAQSGEAAQLASSQSKSPSASLSAPSSQSPGSVPSMRKPRDESSAVSPPQPNAAIGKAKLASTIEQRTAHAGFDFIPTPTINVTRGSSGRLGVRLFTVSQAGDGGTQRRNYLEPRLPARSDRRWYARLHCRSSNAIRFSSRTHHPLGPMHDKPQWRRISGRSSAHFDDSHLYP